jgi:hypothetical protein
MYGFQKIVVIISALVITLDISLACYGGFYVKSYIFCDIFVCPCYLVIIVKSLEFHVKFCCLQINAKIN